MSRLKALGVLPTTCMSFLWNHGMNMLRAYGEELVHRAVPFKNWVDAGVLVINGTYPYPWNPFLSLWAMITRPDGQTGVQPGTDECVTREEALRVYTANGAHLMRMEDRLATLEAGKYADLHILSDDQLAVEVDKIQDIQPLFTLVVGRVVHAAPEFAT